MRSASNVLRTPVTHLPEKRPRRHAGHEAMKGHPMRLVITGTLAPKGGSKASGKRTGHGRDNGGRSGWKEAPGSTIPA